MLFIFLTCLCFFYLFSNTFSDIVLFYYYFSFLLCFFYNEHTFLYQLHICLAKLFYFLLVLLEIISLYQHDMMFMIEMVLYVFLNVSSTFLIYSKQISVFIVVVRFNTQNIDYFIQFFQHYTWVLHFFILLKIFVYIYIYICINILTCLFILKFKINKSAYFADNI